MIPIKIIEMQLKNQYKQKKKIASKKSKFMKKVMIRHLSKSIPINWFQNLIKKAVKKKNKAADNLSTKMFTKILGKNCFVIFVFDNKIRMISLRKNIYFY